MAAITRLGYLGLTVSDLAAWEKLATQMLGFESVGSIEEGKLLFRYDEYACRIILENGKLDDVAFAGWEVSDSTALKALAERLKSSGVDVRYATEAEAADRKVEELIKFSDPSGMPLEVFYGPLLLYGTPFQSPLGVSGFVTGNLGMGHLVVGVDDFAESLKFYTELLGMRETDYFHVNTPDGKSQRIVFLHCNPRHHSLAFSEGRKDKRLRHVMFQVNSLDDVGKAYYRCQDGSAPLAGSLGRHSNDHMVSFYIRTPSGFDLEYGWGAREIDDRTWHVECHPDPSIWGHRGRYYRPGMRNEGAR
jgi:2,3-dihydroxybiphenyl 1,2-dioxygenase